MKKRSFLLFKKTRNTRLRKHHHHQVMILIKKPKLRNLRIRKKKIKNLNYLYNIQKILKLQKIKSSILISADQAQWINNGIMIMIPKKVKIVYLAKNNYAIFHLSISLIQILYVPLELLIDVFFNFKEIKQQDFKVSFSVA